MDCDWPIIIAKEEGKKEKPLHSVQARVTARMQRTTDSAINKIASTYICVLCEK
jgi:hypothetical protein